MRAGSFPLPPGFGAAQPPPRAAALRYDGFFHMKALLASAFGACLALAQQPPSGTVKGLVAADGLEVTLWASEPLLSNPTNIDIDERGRVWVLEGVNYRRVLNGLKDYRAGDRILILEDSDLDGRADKVKVFDQGLQLRSPLGIAVLGNQVIVSQSPDIVVYTKDSEDRIVRREVLLSGWRGLDHDHGVHAVVFGHDGRFYFNSGDQGFDVIDKSGRRLASSRGGPYYAGTALRVNRDGTDMTVLGHNFRNPYELALDSFGNIWQSDNDDDGNAWTRINYVMPGGNFGYWGPGGRGWREDKGSHFHSELPGVVPNIARMGAGSPCGLVVYEGTLLAERYRGRLLHAEAGKRYLNTYFVSPEGAGYTLTTEHTVKAGDTWFRPSDVAVGPDGAVYISDWYDPAVGGHQMKDIERGRIYRLAPAGFRAVSPRLELDREAGLAAALRSPAQSVRYLAWMRLNERGPAALPALLTMARSADPVLRARALWLLGGIPGEGEREVRAALADRDPNFRLLAIRVLQAHGADIVDATRTLVNDPSPAVRREIAVAVAGVPSDAALDTLATLCRLYDGKDRWYLEALGIAARGLENRLYSRLRVESTAWSTRLGHLLWEFRPSDALPYLTGAVGDSTWELPDRIEALEALAAMPSLDAGQTVARLAGDQAAPAALRQQAFLLVTRRVFSEWSDLRKSAAVVASARAALGSPATEARAVEFLGDLGDASFIPDLLKLANRADTAADAVAMRVAAVRAFGQVGAPAPALEHLLLSAAPNEVRAEAVRALGRSPGGVKRLLDLEEAQKLPAEMRNTAIPVVHFARDPGLRARALKLLPRVAGRDKQFLRSPRQILAEEGDAARGRKVFTLTTGPKCASCHTTGEGGKSSVGPDLADIGSKLGKEALLDTILTPSAGIAHQYRTSILDTATEGQVIGIVTEDTPQRITVRNELGDEIRLKPAQVKSRRQSHLSLMPEDLATTMTERELVDLLEYLASLRGGETATAR